MAGVGTVPLPLLPHYAQCIQQVATPAAQACTASQPDTQAQQQQHNSSTQDNMWQVDGSAVTFSNPACVKSLKDMLQQIATQLVIPGKVTAHLRALLLLGPGPARKLPVLEPAATTQDRKVCAMGTLCVLLPSVYTGGALAVQLDDEHASHEHAVAGAHSMHYVATFRDGDIRITDIEEGVWRLSTAVYYHGPAGS